MIALPFEETRPWWYVTLTVGGFEGEFIDVSCGGGRICAEVEQRVRVVVIVTRAARGKSIAAVIALSGSVGEVRASCRLSGADTARSR